MAINVICPGCHTRFKVSDKYAGVEGPCPKCKVKIKIPEKSDEVVIHTPDATLVCRADRAEEIKRLHGQIKDTFDGKYLS